MNSLKRATALMIVLFLLLPAAVSGESPAVFTLIPEAEQRMRYDCVFCENDWPEDIRDEMTARFPGARVIRGILYDWQPLAGDMLTVVFAACETDGGKILAGAWACQDEWHIQIISDRFFREDRQFDIVMKPDHNAEGLVTLYQPAVRYGGEWFVFQPDGRFGFRFAYYERENDWDEDCPDDTRMRVEISEGRDADGRPERCFVISACRIGDFRRELRRGRILDSFDTDMIDASTFPTTFGEVQALCEPNG